MMFKPKKNLGQNFFNNTHLAEAIIDRIRSFAPTLLVEIGPGTGSFTKYFNEFQVPVLCIEKDDELASFVSNRFKNVQVLNADFMEINLEKILKEQFPEHLDNVVVYGSLPYNVSKPIIRIVLQMDLLKKHLYIIQKEVAEKYLATAPNSTHLSILADLKAEKELVTIIHPGSFTPKPKVDSALISFTRSDRTIPLSNENLQKFEKFIVSAFKQPRKTLRNNLKQYNENFSPGNEELLSKRAAQLNLEQFYTLFKELLRIE